MDFARSPPVRLLDWHYTLNVIQTLKDFLVYFGLIPDYAHNGFALANGDMRLEPGFFNYLRNMVDFLLPDSFFHYNYHCVPSFVQDITLFTIASASSWYFLYNSAGFPDSANELRIPIIPKPPRPFLAAIISATEPPSPWTTPSSAVTIKFFPASFSTAFASIGLTEAKSNTEAEIPCAFSISAAFMASPTRGPIAIIAPSEPSHSTVAFPISNSGTLS